MSLWTAYRALSVEQKRALSQKELSLNRPIDELLAFSRPLAACDQLSDKARTPYGCAFAGGLVLGIVALFLLPVNVGNLIGWGVAALIFLAAIASGVAYFRLKGLDISNNFRQFAVPLLTVFREDFDPASPVRVRLDLGSPTDKEKKQSESKPYKQGAYYKVIDVMYLDPWMEGEALLVDGSRLRWSITDSIRERKKKKRTASGKYKMKTKYSKRSEIDVELTLKSKSYTVGHLPGAEVKQGENKQSIRLTRRIKSASLDPIDPKEFIDLVAGIYNGAVPVH